MPVFEKNQTPTGSISLEMRDATGAFVSGLPTVTISKDGGAYAPSAGALAGVTGATGEYEYTPTAAETNCGKFKVRAVLSGAITVTREVLPEVAYTRARAGLLDVLNGLVASVWSYATRTLSPFAAAFDGIAPNAAFFANAPGATVTVSVPAVLPGYTLAEGDLPPIRRGDSWSARLTGLGSLAGRSKLWATAKRDPRRADAQADFGLTEAGFLTTLAGAPPAVGQTGALAVSDASTGELVLTLSAAATAALGPGTLAFDVQMLAGGAIKTLATGNVSVVADVTRAVA